MKTKSKKTKNNVAYRTQRNPFDLFGEIPVYWHEVAFWVVKVTHGRYSYSSKAFFWYVENWNVVEKIKSVKQRYGALEDYLTQCDRW